jgi:tape measure domain-containing protein
MAMTLDTAIKFTTKLEGQGLDQLKRSLQGLAQEAKRTPKDLDRLYAANKKLAQAAGQSINSLNRQVTVLTNLRNEAALGSRQFKFYTAELEKLQRQQARIDSAGAPQGGFLGALGGIKGGLAGVAALVGTAGLSQIAGGIATASMEAENATVRLKALTSTYGEYNQAQQIAAKIASTLRITNTEATDSFSKLYAGLRPTGVGLKELEQIFVGFNVAARVSGATAEETRNAMIQLKQSLVSGVAQGDELRSILEQAPALGQAVADQLSKLGTFGKVTRSQLKELGSEGKITTDVLIEALKQLGDKELPKLEASFNTGSQAVTDLQNAVNKLQVALGNAFGPIALDLIKGFTTLVNGAADAMERFNTSRMDRGQQIATNEQAFRNAAKKIYGDETMGGLISFLNSEFRAQYEQERQRLIAGAQKGPALPEGSGDTREAREAAAAEREATRAAARKKALQDELKIRKDAEDKLADAAQRNAEQIADFQRETIKRAMELERDLADERLKIERQIADTRTKLQQTLEDRQLEAERQRLAAAGLSTEGIETAKEVKEIFRRYDEQRIENERGAVDAQTDLQRRLEEFKTQTADGIGRIQEGYARSVSNILQDAGKKLGQLMEAGAQNAASTLTGAGGAAGAGTGGGFVTGGNLSSQAKALVAAAAKLGVSPLDLATIIGFETGGTYSPSKMGGAGGNYMGLIQFGPNERRQYGAHRGQSFEEQVQGPVVRYFQDRFKGVGMSTQGADLLTLYRTVLGGNPKASLTGRDAFGTSPQSGVAAMAPHRAEARRRFFSGATISGPTPAGAPVSPTMAPPPAGFDPSSIMGGINRAGSVLGGKIDENKRLNDLKTEEQTLAALEQKYTAITGELNQQLKAASDRLRDEKLYGLLLAQGVTPELAKQRVELEAVAAVERTNLETLKTELEARIAILPVESAIRQELEKQVEQVENRLRLQGEVISKTEAAAEAERKAREESQKTEQRAQDMKDLIANIKGTLAQGVIGGIDAAIEAAMTGAKDLDDQLKQIAAGVLKQIGSALIKFGLNSLFPGFGFANGGVMTNNGPAPLKRYSQGGIANRPQLALYGEGSKPEAYVPLPDGRRIPVALQGDKMRDAMGSGPMQAATSPVLNMSFQSTNIGGVEYVSRDQLESAMAATRRQAARDGAKRGMSMTLDKLQQSPSTRSRVGLR